MKVSCDVIRKEVFGIKQEPQVNVTEELQAIKYELERQSKCLSVLFNHLGLELPVNERALECAGEKRMRYD